jgi:hypothetical protein
VTQEFSNSALKIPELKTLGFRDPGVNKSIPELKSFVLHRAKERKFGLRILGLSTSSLKTLDLENSGPKGKRTLANPYFKLKNHQQINTEHV